MSYCINPSCPNPDNPDYFDHCQGCGSSLVYDEFLYRAIRPLEPQVGQARAKRRDTQLYEVACRGSLWVLKVLTNNTSRLNALFERETQILQQLSHEGIPRFEGTFTVVTSNGAELRCLVMEKIHGQTLEQWLEKHRSLSEETALKWLKQLVEILYVVHRNWFIHQDIKPSNIMRTPDDQLVLIDFSNIPGVVSAGYTPLEQAEGNAIPQSDFYALGRTFVHLLTGRHPIDLPRSKTRSLDWRSDAPQISPAFADLIDDLMAPLPQSRPQNAQAILVRINEIVRSTPTTHPISPTEIISVQSPPNGRLTKRLIGMVALSAGLVTALIYLRPQSLSPLPQSTSPPVAQLACNSILDDDLSCGEESLMPGTPTSEKQQGTEAFKQGKYHQSMVWLEKARQTIADPETLIYLNNARLEAQNAKAYTIAIVVPIKTSPNLSTEILRGMAQAQDEINHKKIHGKGLRVLIADDANDLDKAKEVAEALVKRTDILGVLGHYTSEMSLRTIDIYQTHHLALISYGSTSTDLSPYGLQPGHVFFRTVPTTQIPALALTSHLTSQSPRPQKVAVFYNPQSPFSRSLREQFQISIEATGGTIVETFDLCQVSFNAGNALRQAQRHGATAIALFPDGRICAASYPNVLATIRANGRHHPMVASWSLSRSETLESVGEYAVKKLVVAAPWHRLSSPNSKFLQGAKSLWGTNELWNEGVNGTTATTYDAASALSTALADPSQPNSRIDVQNVLSKPNFQATGATGTIRFLGSDRHEPINVLLNVLPSKNCNHYRYSFVPIHHPAAKKGVLNCPADW